MNSYLNVSRNTVSLNHIFIYSRQDDNRVLKSLIKLLSKGAARV